MICANNQVHYGLMVICSYLHITLPHYHHYAHLSEGNKLLRCFSDIFCLECVSKIRSVLSIIFHAIYGAVDLKQVALNNSRKNYNSNAVYSACCNCSDQNHFGKMEITTVWCQELWLAMPPCMSGACGPTHAWRCGQPLLLAPTCSTQQ